LNLNSSITVYPNPSSDYIAIANTENGDMYSIVSANNQLEMSGLIINNGVIDIHKLIAGIYFNILNGKSAYFIK